MWAPDFKRSGVRVLVAVCLVAASAGAGALATGAVLGNDSTIQACAQKDHGQLRVVTSSSQCLPSENPISWNQQAAAAGALGYAHVENGVLDLSRSKNVISMTTTLRFHTNVYCFVLGSTPVSVVGTPEDSPGGTTSLVAAVQGTAAMSAIPCPPGTSAAVEYGIVFPPPQPSPPPSSFYVVFN